MTLADFGVRKPVVAELVMWVIIGAGVVFGFSLRREFFPEIRPNRVLVAAPYPGASPEEIESALARKIEDRLIDLRDIEEIQTTVVEGLATISVEFKEDVDADAAAAEVKREVDALQDLPEQSERITVTRFEPNLPVISLSIVGDMDERVRKNAIREIRDDLRSLKGMGEMRLGGVRIDELIVEVRPAAMLEHNLSLVAIADRVRAAMIDLPGGEVRTSRTTVSVRTLGAEDAAEAVRAIVVKSLPDGRPIRLTEIADIREGFADTELLNRVNGKPSSTLTVFKVGHEDAVAMAEAVKAYAAGRTGKEYTRPLRDRLLDVVSGSGSAELLDAAYELGRSKTVPPPGEIVLTNDLARFIVGRLTTLTEDGLSGAVLIFIMLVIVLNLRAAWWVTTGLMVSIFGTLAAMALLGITLNLLTMFGLIIVLGLLADDAIVISENITARHERGEPAHEAAAKGTNEVYWPVITTVLTMIFAFVPLGLIGGQIGDFLSVLPWVVGAALIVSLLEALMILPAHMAHTLKRIEDERAGRVRPSRLRRFEKWFDAGRDAAFSQYIVPWYTRILVPCVARPWVTLAGCAAVLIISLGMVAGGRLPFVFFEASDSETVFARLRMAIGTPIAQTDAVVRRIEQAALAQPEIRSVYSAVGYSGDTDGANQLRQSHLATIIIELTPVETRDRPSDEVVQEIRRNLGELPGVRSLRLEQIQGGPEGSDIELAVTGPDAPTIMPAVEEIKRELASFVGVEGIADDADSGQRELRLELRPGAYDLGFTPEIIARQVRAALHGIEAHTFAGDREDVDVRVRLPEAERRSVAAIESMHVFTTAGGGPSRADPVPVPLQEIVRVQEAEGYATVRLLDGRRAVTVSAEVAAGIANPEEVIAEIQPLLRRLEQSIPGLAIVERGRQKELSESFSTLPYGILTAAGLIYVCLAWLFQSYVQPLVVMTAIPFATIGMVWGHLLMGYNLTFLSLIGFIALTGIVVNDSLIFIEFFNHRRRDGLSVVDAAIDTGRARIRAILLTTTTTVPGLAPLMMSQSFQARFLIPMAITICFGLMASTVLVLIALPSLLVALDRIRRALRAAWTGRLERGEPTPVPG